ncbi:chlorohydrolase [Streptococcus pneumoniae]|uniref:chlorohydrolase n=1 Tax=Streptococcus pneumoniae TaxID=1313 RepID=UPI000B59431C|nr:chlorohydrolase [Streptococcus pneumoniae]SNK82625.1 chlorohydrolase [Streptococcus pneumoniae]
MKLTKSAQNTVFRLQIELTKFEVVDETDEVSNHTYGKVKLMWFEENTARRC